MKTLVDCKSVQIRVGQNIESIRIKQGKTIKEMALFLKLSDTGYRNIEKGISEIALNKIYLIAEILEVHYSQILEIENSLKIDDLISKNTRKHLVRVYEKCLQQYKNENEFLRKQLLLFMSEKNN